VSGDTASGAAAFGETVRGKTLYSSPIFPVSCRLQLDYHDYLGKLFLR